MINGGLGGGSVIPPSAAAGGTVSLVESTDGSVTVTGGAGPTVNLSVPSGQDGINQLTGDVTAGPGTGSQAATLATVATAGTTGDAAHAPTIQIDAKGRVLSIINNLISITTSQISNLAATLAAYATLASPTFTGTPAAPTATAGTNTTQLATTAFVQTAVGGGGTVTSVFTRTGAVTAQTGDYTVSQVTGAAPLASPTFTGTPAAPTATAGTNTTQLATTAFVATAVAAAVVSFNGRSGAVSPTTGDYTVAQVTGAAPLASPTFTGTPAAPTATVGTNTTQLATTAFVATSFAPLASPALTGSPTAPTQTNTDNSTKIATTAFVQAHQTTALAAVQYAPASSAIYTLSNTALTALDTTNLTTGSFTVPPSGKIKITFAGGTAAFGANTAAQVIMGGWLNHSGGAQLGYSQQLQARTSTVGGQTGPCMVWIISGLTAGSSLQLDLAMYSSVSSAYFECYNATGTGSYGPAEILVEAI